MIYFQKTNYQIAFLIDKESVSVISEWRKGFEYSPHQKQLMLGAADGTPSLPTMLRIVENQKVYLTMEFNFNYTFEGIFAGRQSTDLVYREVTNYPNDVSKPRDIILKIEGEAYQALTAWQQWSEAEAFTGKYSYKFFENPTFDLRYIEVTSSNGEVICLDDSLSWWSNC